jgi:hypothetical protein
MQRKALKTMDPGIPPNEWRRQMEKLQVVMYRIMQQWSKGK